MCTGFLTIVYGFVHFCRKPVSRDTFVCGRYVEARLRRSATEVVFFLRHAVAKCVIQQGITRTPLILISWFLVFMDCLYMHCMLADVFCLRICFFVCHIVNRCLTRANNNLEFD